MTKQKILITGYNGFTGQHLASALRSSSNEVYGLVNDTQGSSSLFQGDLTDITTLRTVLEKIQPDYIVHLAAISFVAHQNSEDFYRVNLFGTMNLLQAAHDVGLKLKKILIASSANVYGNPAEPLIDESVCPLPINHYGNSKLAMENAVRTWFDILPIVMVRPFNYTGPGQSNNFLVPKIVAHFREKKQEIKLGNLDIVRDISDVRFLVECYVRLLNQPVRSDIFNICSGIGYRISDILDAMANIAGYKINVTIDPALVRKNEIVKLVGSNKKLLSVIGDVPSPSLYETLESLYH